MDKKPLSVLRSEAQEIFRAGLAAVDPHAAVNRYLHKEGETLLVGEEGNIAIPLSPAGRILVVGAGKGTARMALAVEDILGERIGNGTISVKYGFTERLERVTVREAGHPLPDRNSVRAAGAILGLLQGLTERDLVLSLISGGGSALLVQPVPGISLEEKQAVTRALLACGATIHEINAIRKHLSRVKGGHLARAASPARVVNLLLSDVVGDRPDVIASGPFVPDASTFEDALDVIEKYGLQALPRSVMDHLRSGARGAVPETPKRGDPLFSRVHTEIVGSNILALQAAKQRAEALGYRSLILSSLMEGETRDVAGVHTAIAREVLRSGYPLSPPVCILSGGETTVTLKGDGKGGRNQEFCLAAALALAGLPDCVVVLSGGTDGNDGPTDAAGAVVDPHTTARGMALGLDALGSLRRNASYAFLSETGDLLVTGPTRTNVMDVRVLLIGPVP